MKRFYIIGLIGLFMIGCAKKADQARLHIAVLKGPSAMGMVKLIDSIRTLGNAHWEVSIYNEPMQIRRLMLQGDVDFAVIPTTMGAMLYNKNIPYRLAAIPVWGTLYLCGSDTTIDGWDRLKGRRVHLMGKGMTPDILFRYLLIRNNIVPGEDVEINYSFPTHIDLANAMGAGHVELGVVSEPLASVLVQKEKTVARIFDLNYEWKKLHDDIPMAQTALMVKAEKTTAQGLAYLSFISSYSNSTRWVNENPEQASALMVKYGILPAEKVAVMAIPRSNLKFVKATDVKLQVYKYLNVFYTMNPQLIGGKIPDQAFIMD